MIKLMHPVGEPTREELDEYVAYALEGRRRVKEQLNKRKGDDEYADIHLSFWNTDGKEVVVWCPESRKAAATQSPVRKRLPGMSDAEPTVEPVPDTIVESSPETPTATPGVKAEELPDPALTERKEQHYKIIYGETGHTYERIFGDYLRDAKKIFIVDPYIRANHQIANFVRFCELVVRMEHTTEIDLKTGSDSDIQKREVSEKLASLAASLKEHCMLLSFSFEEKIHDREVRLDNGWIIKVGRGFDFYQRPDDWYSVGATDFELRPCLETNVDIFKVG